MLGVLLSRLYATTRAYVEEYKKVHRMIVTHVPTEETSEVIILRGILPDEQ